MTEFVYDSENSNSSVSGFVVSPFNLLSTELNSAASGSTTVSSVGGASGVFTSEANFGQCIWSYLWFKSGGALALSPGPATLSIWFLSSPDGVNFEASPPARNPDALIPLPTAVVSGGLYAADGLIRLPAPDAKVALFNGASGALAVSGNELIVGPIAVTTCPSVSAITEYLFANPHKSGAAYFFPQAIAPSLLPPVSELTLPLVGVSHDVALPSGGDDTAAIQAVINAASPGDAIVFPSGGHTWDVTTLNFVERLAYLCLDLSATLHCTSAAPATIGQFSSQNASRQIVIYGITFDSGTLDFNGSSNADSNQCVHVLGCTFQNNSNSNPQDGSGSYTATENCFWHNYAKNGLVQWCTFKTSTCWGGVVGYDVGPFGIMNCAFESIYQPIRFSFDSGLNVSGVVFASNYASGAARIGIELWSSAGSTSVGSNWLIDSNWFVDWQQVSIPSADGAAQTPYSIVPQQCSNLMISNNYTRTVPIGQTRGATIPPDNSLGIECSSNSFTATDNYVDGWDKGVTYYQSGFVITNNNLIHWAYDEIFDGGSGSETGTTSGNTNNPNLPIPAEPANGTTGTASVPMVPLTIAGYPTALHDAYLGYIVGTVITAKIDGTKWQCTSNSVGAATWSEV